jgi:hypothetical protein
MRDDSVGLYIMNEAIAAVQSFADKAGGIVYLKTGAQLIVSQAAIEDYFQSLDRLDRILADIKHVPTMPEFPHEID